MTYGKEIKEFAKVRCEQTPNNTQIARDIKNKFNLDQSTDVEVIRRNVSYWREKWHIEAKKLPIKRLFFDIETGYYILKVRTWQLKNYQKYFNYEDIEREKEIICICYKWEYDDTIHSLDWRMGEKKMLKEFVKIMGESDECIAHNADRFDIPFLRARCLYHGVLMFPNYRSLDTLKKSRNGFLFASNALNYLGKFTGIGGKQERSAMKQTIAVYENGDEKALDDMLSYCKRDVILLSDYYHVLSPFITHNNNFAMLTGGDKWDCPTCASTNVKMCRTYATPMGIIRREMKCDDCKQQYKISNKNYMGMLEHLVKQK